MHTKSLGMSFLTWLTVACSHTTAPGYSLPEPDPSLDPARITLGEIVFACGGWTRGLPTSQSLLVDVAFGSDRPPPLTRPSPEHRAAVRRHGGQILYEFNAPIMRVWIPSGRLPVLARERLFSHASSVPDPRRYDVSVMVGFDPPYRWQPADIDRFSQLGGVPRYQFAAINMIGGPLPDRSIPALRSSPRVAWVEAGGIACLA
ncbi:MAG: hypothetical protein ACRENH_01580 [Gemmatimonadaceae bacterium]